MAITVIDFEKNEQVTTTMKYHGKNRFYISSDLIRALTDPEDEMTKGDEIVITILAINKFKNNGDNKQ